MQSLIINPHVRIMCRNGIFYAVQLSGRLPPFALDGTDFALLDEFMQPRAGADAASAYVFGARQRQLDTLQSLGAVRRRIRQLEKAEILLAREAPNSEPVLPESLTFNQCTGDGIVPEAEFRLVRSFLLLPTPRGLAVHSPTERRYLLPDAPLLNLLLSFASPARPAQLPGVANAAQTLERCGLIINVDNRIAPAGFREKAVRRQPLPQATATWRDLPADSRIPIYFTPHMENHFPLALGMMRSAIEAFDDGSLLSRFQLVPITYLTPQDMLDGPYRRFGPGVWLFSNYLWSVDTNLEISKMVSEHHAGNLCIHGGPSTPSYSESCRQFMQANRSVGIAVHGEGEICLPEILGCVSRTDRNDVAFDSVALEQVAGIAFRDPRTGELTWTAPRQRMRELDIIPSPYLTGAFDTYEGRVEAAIIETNRGCPFGCTFCDWGSATSEKVRKFDLERVRKEIDWIGSRQIQVLWIADANFGMFDRDIEISSMIVDAKARLGYPREVVVNYTKNTNKRLVEIVSILSEGGIISQGIISIQSADETTLSVINRTNIKTEKYDELARIFASSNLPLSVDLMIGLPGITTAAWRRDLQRYFDSDVVVKAYPTRLLPNSPMADPEYIAKHGIRTNAEGFISACNSFTADQLREMKQTYALFKLADGFGLLRYVLRYLQWDHDILALDFLHRWVTVVNQDRERYPMLTWITRVFAGEKVVPGGWHAFYQAVEEFIRLEYALNDDTALAVALEVNEALMPDEALCYPFTRTLRHDFVAYFRDRKAGSGRQPRLADYPPGTLAVDDPDQVTRIDMDFEQYDNHQFFWELRSDVSRARSAMPAASG